MDPYPNPTAGTSITIPIVLPDDDEILIDLYDDKGAYVGNIYNGIIGKGLQFISISTANLRNEIYAFRIVYKSETVVKKIQKL